MSELPENLHYTSEHQWLRLEADNVVCVGITDFAQQQLGDLVYVDLPVVGRRVLAKEQCAVVESVKTASDLSSPVTGEIIAVNSVAVDDPEQINVNPYETWLFSVKADDLSEMDDWLDSQAYLQIIE